MNTETIPAVTPAQLHAGIGCCNQANVECPQDWQMRAWEILCESHSPDVAEAVVRRIAALTVFLQENPTSPLAYGKHGAANILPRLFEAAAVCDLNEHGRFDVKQLGALCASEPPSESQPAGAGNPASVADNAASEVGRPRNDKTIGSPDVSWPATLCAAIFCGLVCGGLALAVKAVLP